MLNVYRVNDKQVCVGRSLMWILGAAVTPGGDFMSKQLVLLQVLGDGDMFGRWLRVRLWGDRRWWRCRGGGADGSVLVARAVAADRRQGVWIQGFGPCGGQVRPVCRCTALCCCRCAAFGAQDEPGLVLLLQTGDVLQHAFTVGHRQLVGAVRHQVEVTDDEDDGEREHGHDDEREAHAQRPRRVALETLLSL